jgi:hypothetical protein
VGLIEDKKGITLANQDSNTMISFWKTRYQLKYQMVVVARRANIPQLVRDHLKMVIISKHIGKIIHASVRELLLEGAACAF